MRPIRPCVDRRQKDTRRELGNGNVTGQQILTPHQFAGGYTGSTTTLPEVVESVGFGYGLSRYRERWEVGV